MRFLSLGHKGKPHGGEAGEDQDQRVVQRAGSQMGGARLPQTK
jgi:hypothetical protein